MVGDELAPAGREGGDSVTVPLADPRPEENPIDQRLLGVGLVGGNAGVSRDIVLPRLEAGLSGERGGEIGVRRRGVRILAIGRGRLEAPVADGDPSARA